jgi:peptidyl-tRNA hydrolase, PTH1 family
VPLHKIVVGLGNPGAKYDRTRHNIGFAVLDSLVREHSGASTRVAFEAKLTSIEVGRNKVLLVWPQTYMNHSGRCVRQVVNFYKTDIQRDLLIIGDDLSLPLGKLRVRPQGSAGGQKGLADILAELGSQSVARLRIGIDACPEHWDAADYVLSRFRLEELPEIQLAVQRACSAVEAWCTQGIEYCMNQFNH